MLTVRIQIKIGESYFITSSYMQGTKYSLHEHTNSPSYIKKMSCRSNLDSYTNINDYPIFLKTFIFINIYCLVSFRFAKYQYLCGYLYFAKRIETREKGLIWLYMYYVIQNDDNFSVKKVVWRIIIFYNTHVHARKYAKGLPFTNLQIFL